MFFNIRPVFYSQLVDIWKQPETCLNHEPQTCLRKIKKCNGWRTIFKRNFLVHWLFFNKVNYYSLTNKTIQLLNTQTKQKQHKKQQIKLFNSL